MSFCSNCGKELVPGAKFCFECGTPVIYNQHNDNSSNTKRKVVFEGDIHKCPNCGEVLSSFALNCPACGHEIRGVETSKAIQEFTMRLYKAESPSEKVSIIRNYTVPNTKEDIYEFMILASSNIRAGIEMELANAWESKLDQVIKKAKLIMHGQDEYRQLKEIYCQVIEKLNKQKKRENIKKLGGKLSELVPVLPNAIMVFGWLISLVVILVLCIRVSDKRGYQLLFMADFIVGAFWVPFTFKGGGVLTKLLTTAGLILSIVLLIPLCGKNVDNVGANGYQLLLIVDFVCCARIISQMIRKKSEPVEGAENTNGISFLVTIACVLILVLIYGIGNISIPRVEEKINNSPTVSANTESDDDTTGIHSYDVRNYVGKNMGSVGKVNEDKLIDTYGSGEISLALVTEDGMLILPVDDEVKKQYVIVDQNTKSDSKITIVNKRDSEGKPYSNLVDYQSVNEIILYVAPIGKEYKPRYIEIKPTLDKHKYHIKDYVGRNAASFGRYNDSDRVDEYGAAELRIAFKADDGSFIDSKDINILKNYLVINQDIAANTELEIEYLKDSDGEEYDSLVESQSYEEITLTVKKLESSIISNMPEIKSENK